MNNDNAIKNIIKLLINEFKSKGFPTTTCVAITKAVRDADKLDKVSVIIFR